jgi:hypothetical protein
MKTARSARDASQATQYMDMPAGEPELNTPQKAPGGSEICDLRCHEAGFSTVGTFRLWLPSLRRLTLTIKERVSALCWLLKSPVTWPIVPAFAESPAAGLGDGCAMREEPPSRLIRRDASYGSRPLGISTAVLSRAETIAYARRS